MDSASSPQNSNKRSCSVSKSPFTKTVCLKDWWLKKPENNSNDSPLAIAGITSREKRAVRVFVAPVKKRWDVTTLETIDGVFVIIRGFMDKARTEANGFSSEICKHFVYGFPSDWKILAKKCYVGDIRLLSVPEISLGFEPLSPLPDSIIKSPQKDCPLLPCHVTKKSVPKMSVSVAEDVNKTESCKKSLTENFLKSSAVLEVENHSQMHREEIMPKSGSLNGDYAISNAEAVPVRRSRGRPALKKTVNNGDSRTCNKSVAENILKSPAVMEVQNHGQKRRKVTDSFGNNNLSNDKEIMPKSGSMNGGNAISNAEPANKSRDRPMKTVNNDDTRTCKKSLTENFLKSPAVMVVENHGLVHRESTDSFSNDNMSKVEEIMPKPGSVDNAIANIEAIPAHKIRGQSALKKNNVNSGTVTPHNSHSRGCLSSSKKMEKDGGIKQSISQSATPRPRKPVNKLAYETPTSHKRKDKSTGITPLSSVKRSRSGRLLLPKLEFWRNQIAVYDMDRQITDVNDLDLDALSEGRKK